MKTRIAVYGSLIEGLGNHRVLSQHGDRVEKIGESIVPGFKLYSLGAFPGAKRSKAEHTIKVEVYDVDDVALDSVRRLEGYSVGGNNTFYDEIDVTTNHFGNARMYLFMPPVENLTEVPNGDWKTYKKSNYEYYI